MNLSERLRNTYLYRLIMAKKILNGHPQKPTKPISNTTPIINRKAVKTK